MKKIVLTLLVMGLLSQPVLAEFCDHKPSRVISGVAGTTALIGGGMKAAGLYAFPHAAGMTMLGSTAAGSSAAGTVGIIGGTGGAVGTVGAFLISPVVIGSALVVAGGAVAYEGGCYLSSK